jgi:hypothetical protein
MFVLLIFKLRNYYNGFFEEISFLTMLYEYEFAFLLIVISNQGAVLSTNYAMVNEIEIYK